MSQEDVVAGHRFTITDDDPNPTISAREFVDFGYLQELNRNFLAPLGLVMEIAPPNDEERSLGELKIFDFRKSPERAILPVSQLDSQKAENVSSALDLAGSRRLQQLGFLYQPMPSDKV